MPAPHERLDHAMSARRLDLGKQWKDIATEAGISTAALGAIRRGENKPSPLTARRLEEALQWERDSIEATLEGGEPTPIGGPADRPMDEMSTAELIAKAQALMDEANEYLRRARGETG